MQNFKHRFARQRRQGGFTLVEIMVVVVIIGILGALVVPKLLGRTGESRVAAARVDISTLMSALKLYKLDNQRYPTTEQGLQSLVQKPTSGPPATAQEATTTQAAVAHDEDNKDLDKHATGKTTMKKKHAKKVATNTKSRPDATAVDMPTAKTDVTPPLSTTKAEAANSTTGKSAGQ